MNGRIVAITGASGRLGRRIVQAYHDAGATLVAMERSLNDDDEIAAMATLRLQLDATDERSVKAAFRQAASELGPIDVLVHTVGTWDGRPFLETSLDRWSAMMDLNLTSAFLCFREALRQMEGKGGILIGIASGQGADRGASGQAPYSASKGGLIRMIEAIAAEYQGSNISAHAIAPSTILFEDTDEEQGVPAGDIADLCLYLSTPSGKSLNGATLRAYGP